MIRVDRRNLLRAAVAAPAVPLLTGSAAQAADKTRGGTGERFALATPAVFRKPPEITGHVLIPEEFLHRTG